MTTKELYRSIGASVYEHQGCWRKDGIFHIRMEAPLSCHKCPKCGNREVIHRGTFTRLVHAPRITLFRKPLGDADACSWPCPESNNLRKLLAG